MLQLVSLLRAWVAEGAVTRGFTAMRWRDRRGVTVFWSEALMLYLIYCEGRRVKIYFSIRNSHQCLEGGVRYYGVFVMLLYFLFFSWSCSIFFYNFPFLERAQVGGFVLRLQFIQ